MREIEIEWPDFGVTVCAQLQDEENPRQCEELWQALPFDTIFASSMSAGEMFKIPVPVSFSEPPKEKLVYFPEQPAGTIMTLPRGESMVVKYGVAVEPFRILRLARMSPSELSKFLPIAVRLRDAYFFTKQVNRAFFRRKPPVA